MAYIVTVESQDDPSDKFRVDASRFSMIARPDPETNPPKGVYIVMLKDDPEPGKQYWTHDLDLSKLGN